MQLQIIRFKGVLYGDWLLIFGVELHILDYHIKNVWVDVNLALSDYKAK